MIHMYFMVWKELIYTKMPLLMDLGEKKNSTGEETGLLNGCMRFHLK